MRRVYVNHKNLRNRSNNNLNLNQMNDDKKPGDDKGGKGKPKPKFDMRGLFMIIAIGFGLWGVYTVFESKKKA